MAAQVEPVSAAVQGQTQRRRAPRTGPEEERPARRPPAKAQQRLRPRRASLGAEAARGRPVTPRSTNKWRWEGAGSLQQRGGVRAASMVHHLTHLCKDKSHFHLLLLLLPVLTERQGPKIRGIIKAATERRFGPSARGKPCCGVQGVSGWAYLTLTLVPLWGSRRGISSLLHQNRPGPRGNSRSGQSETSDITGPLKGSLGLRY